MDQKDVEMEDAGQLLGNEVVAGQECAGKDDIAINEAGDKQQDSSGLVNADVIAQSPNEIGVVQEEKEVQEEREQQEVQEEEEVQEELEGQEVQEEQEEQEVHEKQEVHEQQEKQGIQEERKVQEEQEEQEVQKVQEEQGIKEVQKVQEEHGMQKVQEVQEEQGMQEVQKVQEEQGMQEVQKVQEEHGMQEVQEEQGMQEVQKVQEEQGMQEEREEQEVQKVQEEQRNQDAEEVYPEKTEQELPVDETQNIEKDDTTMMDEDKIIDSKNETPGMIGDDMVDDSKNDATDLVAEDKSHDLVDNHGVIEESDHVGSIKIPENNDKNYAGYEQHQPPPTPNALMTYAHAKAEDHIVIAETPKNELDDTTMDEGYESGTAEEQEAFMREVDAVYREKHIEFKPPKFYGQPLNCLKLWRSVIKLGGYDRVTGAKWWRQVGEAFHPPKTCTTVSWTFRQFYEKALLEYERHKVQTREIELPLANVFPEAPTVDHEANGHQTPGSGRARRDAAARAMQGWHAQRLLGFGGEEKNSNNPQKREKSLKSIGSSLKHKRPSEMEYSAKAARTETSRQVVTTVADVGAPANWVKINVRETKDCFEVYALVPGLLREEVRVQSDPAGRLVITGQPEQLDNPWGISAFKKVISLPGRIDPLRTSAIVSLHGRLLVRVPFEQSNI